MKHLVLATMLLILQSQAGGAGLDRCPRLPDASKLLWHFDHDPRLEFDVCYATEPDSDVQVFGFYFSKTPPGFVDDPEPIGPGTVAEHGVTWFGRGSNLNVGPFSRRAIITPHGHSREFVLVYLYANDPMQLRSRLEILWKTRLR